MNKKTVKKGLFPYVFLFVFIFICLFAFNSFNTKINKLTYDDLKEFWLNNLDKINKLIKETSK